MAERFEETVNIQPQDISTGGVQAAQGLAQRLDSFTAQAFRQSSQFAARKGAEAGAAADADDPDFKSPGIFTGTYDRAYNATLRAGYMAGVDNDMRESLAKIESEHPDDLISFNEALAGYQKGAIAGVDPFVRQAASLRMDNLVSDAQMRVQGATQRRFKAEADDARTDAMTSITDDGIRAVREGNQLAAAESIVAYQGFVQTLIEDGTILTEETADRMVEDYTKSLATENIRTLLNNQLDEPGGIVKVTEAILTFRDAPLEGFSVEEQEDMYNVLVADLSGALTLRNRLESAEDDALLKWQKSNSEALYLGVLNGTTTNADVASALGAKRINQQQAQILISAKTTKSKGVSDYGTIRVIKDEIRGITSPEDAEELIATIAANTGPNLTKEDASKLVDEVNKYIDQGTPLKTQRAVQAQKALGKNMRPYGIWGKLDADVEARITQAEREFSERVLAGEDPWDVADSLLIKDRLGTATIQPKYGSKNDLDGVLVNLDNMLRSAVTRLKNRKMKQPEFDNIRRDYNREYKKVQDLIADRDQLAQFALDRKEAQNGG